MSTGWGRTCVFCKLRQGRELDVFLNLDLKNVPLMRLSPGEGSSKELMPYGDRRGLGRQKPGQISTPGDTMACEAKSDLYELEEKTLRCQLRLSVLLSLRLSP